MDTNAGRVLARAAAGRSLGRAEAQAVVDAMVPQGGGWQFGQAILDLGATVCTPAPACGACPGPTPLSVVGGRPRRTGPRPGFVGCLAATVRASTARTVRAAAGWSTRCATARSAEEQVASVLGWSAEAGRAARVVADLVAEGLVVRDKRGVLRLPS